MENNLFLTNTKKRSIRKKKISKPCFLSIALSIYEKKSLSKKISTGLFINYYRRNSNSIFN